jgi:hypothetical protein
MDISYSNIYHIISTNNRRNAGLNLSVFTFKAFCFFS